MSTPSTAAPTAKFTQGSILRHILIMTASSAAGLIAMFSVELIDIYYLSLLGQTEITAAVGYAGSLVFFTVSISIGLMIACSALLSRIIGSGDKALAKHYLGLSFVTAFFIAVLTLIIVMPFVPLALTALGATGVTKELAASYLYIVLPSMLVMMPALCGGGALRAVGDAKGSMMLTLSGAMVNLALDPLFIFGLNMGIEGAAFATAISRIAMLIYVMHKLRQHQLLGKPDFSGYREFAKRYFHIGLPAILTNLSTPISVVILTVFMAKFGDDVVAGNAVISRIQPVAFAALFALSGAIGPIAGQNLGAKLFDRVDATLQQGIKFVVIYTVITCLIIALLTEVIIWGFNVTGAGIELVQVFCWGLSLIFIFNGITFLTNALFNNLGKAHWATYMNFGKSTIGTLPFVWLGAYLYGPVGIYWGLFIGSAIFALIAWWLCARLLQQIRLAG